MPSQEERRAANEHAFREANERIRASSERLKPPMERVPFLCECFDLGCRTLVQLTPAEYERIRAHPNRFLVAPGHEHADELTEDNGRYTVVAKQGEEGAVARELDPRTGA